MANINWPNPSFVGEIYVSDNGDSWKWTGQYWQSLGTSSISGSGASNQVTIWNGINSITGSPRIAYTDTPGTNVNITISDSGFSSILGRGFLDTSVNNGGATSSISSGSNLNTVTSVLEFKKSRNTIAVPNTVTNGTVLGEVRYSGAYDSLGNYRTGVVIRSEATETWSSIASGNRFSILTTSNGFTGLAERIAVEGNGLVKLYGSYTFPNSNGTNNQVLTTNGAGTLSWSTITAAGLGAVSGAGTLNYIAKWTGGTTLTNSLIRDDGNSVAINNNPSANTLLSMNVNTHQFGLVINHLGTNAVNTGAYIQAYGSSSTQNTALNLNGTGSTGTNFGLISTATGPSGSNIGVRSSVSLGANNYAIQLIDGYEGTAGRFLKNMDTTGKGRWVNITTADVSGSVLGAGTGGSQRLTLWTDANTITSNSLLTYIASTDTKIVAGGANNTVQIGGSDSGIYSNSFSQFFMRSTNNTGNFFPIIDLSSQRGTTASPTPPLNADILMEIRSRGSSTSPSAVISTIASQNHVTGSALGAELVFKTNANGQAATQPAIRLKITNTGAIRFNEAYTFPTTDGTIGQILSTNGSGALSWSSLSSLSIPTGTGTSNYVTRWTGTNTQGIGIIQDNGSQVSIGPTAISGTQKLRVWANGSPYINHSEFIHTGANQGINKSFLFTSESTNASIYNYGIVSRATIASGIGNNANLSYGVLGIAGSTSLDGSTTGNFNVGVKGVGYMKALSTNNTNAAVGVQGMAFGGVSGATSYGVFAYGSDANNLGFALQDTNQAVGRFIKCINSEGGATWANITAADISGVVGGAGAANKLAFWTNGSNISYNTGLSYNGNSTDPGIILQSSDSGNNSNIDSNSIYILATDTYAQSTLSTRSNSYFPIFQLIRGSSGGGAPADNSSLGRIRWGSDINAGTVQMESFSAGVHSSTNLGSSFILSTRYRNGPTASNITPRFTINGGFYNALVDVYNTPQISFTNSTVQIGNANVISTTILGDRRYQLEVDAIDSPSGIYVRTNKIPSGDQQVSGIYSISLNNLGDRIGIYGLAASSDTLNVGLKGEILTLGTGYNIGAQLLVPTGANSYSVQLQDGTEAAGKFLKSMDSSGRGQWANVSPVDYKNSIYRTFGAGGLGLNGTLGLTASTDTVKAPIKTGGESDPLSKEAKCPNTQFTGFLAGAYNASTGVFTIPTSGWYEISYQASLSRTLGWPSGSSLSAMIVDANLTGNYYMSSRVSGTAYNPFLLNTSDSQTFYFNSGTTFFLRLLLNGTLNYVVNTGDRLEMTVKFLGN